MSKLGEMTKRQLSPTIVFLCTSFFFSCDREAEPRSVREKSSAKEHPASLIKIIPLAERTVAGSGKLFTLLDDEAIGVRFVRKPVPKEALERMKDSPSFTDEEGMRGVCAGDFDGDGRPDLFYAYPFGGHRLFRNLGGFRFQDVTVKSGLAEIVADHWAVVFDYSAECDPAGDRNKGTGEESVEASSS